MTVDGPSAAAGLLSTGVALFGFVIADLVVGSPIQATFYGGMWFALAHISGEVLQRTASSPEEVYEQLRQRHRHQSE